MKLIDLIMDKFPDEIDEYPSSIILMDKKCPGDFGEQYKRYELKNCDFMRSTCHKCWNQEVQE